ncbi:MAG TPA: DUF5635 domain-containing protein [Candidatus Micrarchaeaceae archaeon]|nr:DUF5635 domain-containing protein [Candidatus Micrarchaeaceae archaeon]
MYSGLSDEREALRGQVALLLRNLGSGTLPARLEWEKVDLKEEPGRRGSGGILLPGEVENLAAADYLAKEVCCFANTPGGGALILGVEDGTGQPLGTNLDMDWLRNRIYQRSDIAPAIEEHDVAGQRVLVLYVAESPEPIEDHEKRIRWRVGDNCQPVDRSEWWVHQESRGRLDTMATATQRNLNDASASALEQARRYLTAAGDDVTAEATDHQLLTRVGALTPHGQLTEAGALLFCNSERRLITLSRFDAIGGSSTGTWEADHPQSLLEQLAQVEVRLDAYNGSQTISYGLVSEQISDLPTGSIREAILNGLMHRDWHLREPTTVEWVDVDSRLTITSPGGFSGGINESNVLTNRHSRYPALSDLFRALGLVDKQGIGVDRMYREMISRGHRPPHIRELDGPRVQTILVGGTPVVPVMHLMASIRPIVRQRDVRIALLVHTLLRYPFVSNEQAASVLQTSVEDAATAIDSALETTVMEKPLVEPYKDVWKLGRTSIDLVRTPTAGTNRHSVPILPYFKPKVNAVRAVVDRWLDTHELITSGDVAALTCTLQSNASRQLSSLEGVAITRGEVKHGRNAHYMRLVQSDTSAEPS